MRLPIIDDVQVRQNTKRIHQEMERPWIMPIRVAWEMAHGLGLGKQHKLLSKASTKMAKSNRNEVRSYDAAIYMAAHMSSGLANACSGADDCINPCIVYTGRSMLHNGPQKTYAKRLYMLIYWPNVFFTLLYRELEAHWRAAQRRGAIPAVRLNGTTDIPWEKVAPWLFKDFPTIQFHDYTKVYSRLDRKKLPDNYYLTFSESSSNHHRAKEALERGWNVSFCSDVMPRTWHGFPVTDGDHHDSRYLDPRGHAVWLSPKRPNNGFDIRTSEFVAWIDTPYALFNQGGLK
ncbi:MAG: hypothetical protein CMJ20_06845 [Phycisphaeraceae bacterium]|nr:hypothetical protein [Phycisphaeraceae bacterium]